MIKIAVAYKDEQIFEHFGHAEQFAFYEFNNMENANDFTKKIIDVSALHGHQAMADLMKDEEVDAVLVGNMGGEAKALLLSYGIVPVAGYCGRADTAAVLLASGQLPINEGAGGCSGGCSGCSGNCGGEESCDCGCGC